MDITGGFFLGLACAAAVALAGSAGFAYRAARKGRPRNVRVWADRFGVRVAAELLPMVAARLWRRQGDAQLVGAVLFTMGAPLTLVATQLLNLRRVRGYYRRNSPPPQPLPEPRPC